MSCLRTSSVLAAALIWAPLASALDAKFTLKKADGSWTCTPSGAGGGPGDLKVFVQFQGGTPAKASLRVTSDPAQQAIEGKLIASGLEATVAAAALKERYSVDLTVEDAPVSCGGPFPLPPPRASSLSLDNLDLHAQAWLLGAGAAKLKAVTDALRARPLLHLPSGAPALGPGVPFPSAVTEGTALQVLLVVYGGAGRSVSIAIKECPERDRFRVQDPPVGLLEGKEEIDESLFDIVPVGATLSCGAPQLRYVTAQVVEGQKPGDREKETTIRMRPVFQVAPVVIWAFDFANRDKFAVRDGKVAQQRDKYGSSSLVGFTWFVGGVDYEDMKTRNHFLNPFLAFDLTAPKDNFAAGLALTANGGVSVALGASFRRSTVLDGLAPGDPFNGKGDVPTRKVWNRKSIGLFVGVALDGNAFGKIKKAWGGLSGSASQAGRKGTGGKETGSQEAGKSGT